MDADDHPSDLVLVLSVLCGVFGSLSIILASILISRCLIARRHQPYMMQSKLKYSSSTDKVLFTKEDLIWATENVNNNSMRSIDIAIRSRKTTTQPPGGKLMHMMSKMEQEEVERSGYTIMSSVASMDQKISRRNIAYLHGKRRVYCNFITSSQVKEQSFKRKTGYLKELRGIQHENVNCFWGVFSDPYKQGFLYDYGKRGSLKDALIDSGNKMALDWNFKQSLMRDLVNGMRFIQRSAIKAHGRLKSSNCIIDHRWVLKVSGFGLNQLADSVSVHEKPEDWLWTAPEHLRENQIGGSPKGDVYSFAIILQEIITESGPYSMVHLTAAEIIKKVMKPPPLCRPSVSNGLAPPPYIHLMKECWNEQADRRPSFDDVYRQLRAMHKGEKTNIIDNILKKLEKYSSHLEDIVKDRTVALEGEKKKTEQLLCRMLPPSVAEVLKAGEPVHPEHYEQVTIFFSDIVGFTTISAASTPMQIVDLLNMMYTRFDEIIDYHDIYKVETIGDAYMCASGLPVRNGNCHAGEIATMALELLSAALDMKVPHLPNVPLKLRIGCHSGHCAAGVVGLTMPRYCLFGDTVNTASRMESHSQAEMIHISSDMNKLLQDLGGYKTVDRGLIDIKGKGKMRTYWLVGKDGFNKPLPGLSERGDDCHGLESLLTEVELETLLTSTINLQNSKTKHVNNSMLNLGQPPCSTTTVQPARKLSGREVGNPSFQRKLKRNVTQTDLTNRTLVMTSNGVELSGKKNVGSNTVRLESSYSTINIANTEKT